MAEKKSLAAFNPTSAPCAAAQTAPAMGNDNVGAGDQAIPRLNILQALSPQLDDSSAKYIDGAKAGYLAESISGDVFDQLFVVNLDYKREYAVFKKRTVGGGYLGSYGSEEEAQAALDAGVDGQGNTINASDYDIVEQGNHVLLMLDETGAPVSPALMSFSSTALKVSKAWNSQLLKKNEGLSRFASVWSLSTIKESNNRGSWYAPKVEFAGYCPDELFQEAEKVYSDFKS